MNHRQVYIALMRRAEGRQVEGYSENHHIFPVSVYGKNNRTVKLTAKEHYLAHLLIWRDFQKRYGNTHWKTTKMAHAYWLMATANQGKHRVSSRAYELARRVYSEARTGFRYSDEAREKMAKSATGNRNALGNRARLGQPHSEETKKKISEATRGRKHTPEAKQKMSASRTGRKQSAETRARRSETMKAIWAERKAGLREAA